MNLIAKIKKLVNHCKANNSEYFRWEKDTIISFSDNFFSDEFECKCNYESCVEQKIEKELISKLQQLRDEIGPIQINSGYRCIKHQSDIRKSGIKTAKKTSQHELGRAADICLLLEFHNAFINLKVSAKYFKAIGIAKHWTHVDLRDEKIRRWSY